MATVEVDQWEEEEVAEAFGNLDEGSVGLTYSATSSPVQGARGSVWELLQKEIKAAEVTGSFSFAHHRLDALAALSLTTYLRDECKARSVDLSHIGHWQEVAVSLASSLQHGLRATRTLRLDGNDLGSPEVLQAWCHALEEHPGLQHISLRRTGLDDQAAAQLAEVLRRQRVLFSMDLRSNQLTDRGVVSLTEALSHNHVLVDLDVTRNYGVQSLAALEEALDRNRARYGGRLPVRSEVALQRVRLGADACVLSLKADQEEVVEFKSLQDLAACKEPGTSPRSSPLAMLETVRAIIRPGEDPLLPPDQSEAEAVAEQILFDAGDGLALLQEMSRRCDAGWGHDAHQREAMLMLRSKIFDLQVQRRCEQALAKEAESRLAQLQQQWQQKLAPVEERLVSLREAVVKEDHEIQAVLRLIIQRKVELKTLEDELHASRSEHQSFKTTLTQAEWQLRQMHRMAAEEQDSLEQQILKAVEEAEHLAKENERCRRKLHAMRFETESERFIPCFTQQAH